MLRRKDKKEFTGILSKFFPVRRLLDLFVILRVCKEIGCIYSGIYGPYFTNKRAVKEESMEILRTRGLEKIYKTGELVVRAWTAWT